MGLDLVEILISIEDEFTIEIREEAASTLSTISDLVDYVEREIQKDEIPQWKANQIYSDSLARTKREITAALEIPESAIDPMEKLTRLIPKNKRRWIWISSPFFQEIGSLTLSGSQIVFTVVVSFLFGLVFFVFGEECFGEIGALIGWAIGLIVLFVSFIALYVSLPRTTIDSRAETVSDCARLLATKEGVRLNKTGENWTRPQIEHRIMEIISENAGIKLERLKLENRLVEDLNLG